MEGEKMAYSDKIYKKEKVEHFIFMKNYIWN